MADINHLIQLNVQLEGLLKVLLERDSIHARSALADKYREYAAELEEFLAEPTAAGAEATAQAAQQLRQQATYTEVKDQEAQEAEDIDETDAAAAAIARGAAKEAAKGENTVETAFTLNDKFRFIRDVFGGNERDFTDTVSLIAGMDNYAEAEEYITTDMMLDPDNEAVADFLEVLRNHMPA